MKINIKELVKQKWTRKDANEVAPNVLKCIEAFNKVFLNSNYLSECKKSYFFL